MQREGGEVVAAHIDNDNNDQDSYYYYCCCCYCCRRPITMMRRKASMELSFFCFHQPNRQNFVHAAVVVVVERHSLGGNFPCSSCSPCLWLLFRNQTTMMMLSTKGDGDDRENFCERSYCLTKVLDSKPRRNQIQLRLRAEV